MGHCGVPRPVILGRWFQFRGGLPLSTTLVCVFCPLSSHFVCNFQGSEGREFESPVIVWCAMKYVQMSKRLLIITLQFILQQIVERQDKLLQHNNNVYLKL